MFNTDMPTRAELPSTRKLIRSTLIAAGIAIVLLLTIVLPSEYGIDPTRIGGLLGLTKMGDIKTRLAREAQQEKELPKQAAAPIEMTVEAIANANPDQQRTDDIQVVLKPGEGAEVKLALRKDAKITYEWSSAGGAVNHDTHGDGAGQSHRYKKEMQVLGDSGELKAAFDGHHGWFWRNRNTQPVTISLRCSGIYQSIKRVS